MPPAAPAAGLNHYDYVGGAHGLTGSDEVGREEIDERLHDRIIRHGLLDELDAAMGDPCQGSPSPLRT
jgi:hypothetical protein